MHRPAQLKINPAHLQRRDKVLAGFGLVKVRVPFAAHQRLKDLLCFAHLYLQMGCSVIFSGGGGVIFSLGGVQPHLRQVA